MARRCRNVCLVVALMVPGLVSGPRASACCPAPPSGRPVVNADQTVILLWDAATHTQHFIRKASFRSDADDFGFIVPTPNVPELEESGDAAFPYLLYLTKPEVKTVWRPVGIGCASREQPTFALAAGAAHQEAVRVLQEKEVAGFNAVVLEASTAGALVAWLREHGYAYSPEVAAWAKPYVEGGWKFVALKVAKDPSSSGKGVAASALRISFHTDRPLFPYREPDPAASAEALGVKHRLLRIYFVAEARYRGELTPEKPWTGRVAWAGKLTPQARQKLLELLKLPADAGPAAAWLTEFEDDWPYRAAPADVYFSRDKDQGSVRRDPIIRYVSSGGPGDVSLFAVAAVVVIPPLLRRVRKTSGGPSG